MPIRSDLQAELDRLGPDSSAGAWSLVVWADRKVKEYSSRHLAPLGTVVLEAWHSAQKSPMACSMAIYPSEDLHEPGATDFLVLFRAFGAPQDPPFIVGEERLHDVMEAEAEAIRQRDVMLEWMRKWEPPTDSPLDIDLF